jgi:hypothetical protein
MENEIVCTAKQPKSRKGRECTSSMSEAPSHDRTIPLNTVLMTPETFNTYSARTKEMCAVATVMVIWIMLSSRLTRRFDMRRIAAHPSGDAIERNRNITDTASASRQYSGHIHLK